MRTLCRQFVGEFASLYPKSKVLYASKAFVNSAIVQLVTEEGLGMDVVSAGEVAIAKAGGSRPG